MVVVVVLAGGAEREKAVNAPWEFVSHMRIMSSADPPYRKQNVGRIMQFRPQNQVPYHHRQQACEHVLDDAEVLSRQGNHVRVLVVHLVETIVEEFVMKNIVEEAVDCRLDHLQEPYLEEDSPSVLEGLYVSAHLGVVSHNVDEDGHHDQRVEHNHFEAVFHDPHPLPEVLFPVPRLVLHYFVLLKACDPASIYWPHHQVIDHEH